MRNKAIDTAKMLCDTMIRKFPEAKDLPPERRFFYHQGVFLSGMMNTYELCEEEKYYDYVKVWIDSLVDEDGKINSCEPHNWLDDIQPGILLYPLYKKTGDERYKKALDFLVGILKNWKKNKAGGFWHSNIHPDQMWLDSLYMGSPILAQYAKEFSCPEFWDETAKQAIIMYENMTNPQTGLMLHAWDESKLESWADKETGLSDETWGRAQGWYVVAIMDILSFMPSDHPYRQKLIDIEREILGNIMKYRDEKSKLWYQVVPKGNEKGNWIENSCSFLFITAIAKAVRLGVLDEKYKIYANECFEGALRNIDSDGEDLLINHVCIGTCIFDYQGYIDRPTSVNDLHGTGAFLLMCSEIARIN
ncbi:MAG: glycoside hydrolase 105 family protein [Ruminococcaceae bacterium]|nr:glycoside hydrolase 105 family protein [Oscillospiraceae bacterium]